MEYVWNLMIVLLSKVFCDYILVQQSVLWRIILLYDLI